MSKQELDPRDFLLGCAADEAYVEARRACAIHPTFNSFHEGWAVVAEEVDELWGEVKKKQHDKAAMRHEAIQIAAMAIRFAAELTTNNDDQRTDN